jgi:hypothetical protein
MESVDAKQFLITRVIEEGEVEQVRLSDVEKKMLSFTETYPSLPDIYEVNAEFERDYDSDEYEAKIAGLLKRARERDKSESPGRAHQWKDALEALRKEDHYILVMASQAFGAASEATSHRFLDFLVYVAVGLGLIILLIYFAYIR